MPNFIQCNCKRCCNVYPRNEQSLGLQSVRTPNPNQINFVTNQQVNTGTLVINPSVNNFRPSRN